MKILHLLSQRPDSTGSGIYLQAILRESAKMGHHNVVIAGTNKGSSEKFNSLSCKHLSLVEFESPELEFSIPGMSNIMPYRSSKFYDLSERELQQYESVFLEKISKQIHLFSPEIIHSHHLWLVSSLIKKHFPDIPVVTSCHGSDLRQFLHCIHLHSRVLSGCKKLDRIFALTQPQKNQIALLYGIPSDKIDVVGAGYNDNIFSVKRKKDIPPPLQFLYCGKLSRAKGVPSLLKAMQHLDRDDWHLHLAGSGTGPDIDECLALAELLKESVTLHGKVSQETLASLLQQTHVFVLPSLYEGLPLVILEALACGCKVIATDLPGCREIYQNTKSGFISLIKTPPLANVDTLSQKHEKIFIKNIRKELLLSFQLFDQKPFEDRDAIVQNIDQYTWEKVFGKIERAYKRVV